MGDATHLEAVELAERILGEVETAEPDWRQVTAWAQALAELTAPLRA